MKIVTIVGARPQFIKVAAVSRILRRQPDCTELLVHTGQHYDANMSDVFFQELGIPTPDFQLNIGSGGHGEQTGRMLRSIERVLLDVSPDWVLVYGDTNSTLAGALAAVKLHIPVAHVEAGLRSFNRKMPEEINRVLTDHASTLLFAPTRGSGEQLLREGLSCDAIHQVGDVMYDATMYYSDLARQKSVVQQRLNLERGQYLVATIHRAENTDEPARLAAIIDGLVSAARETKVVFPVHPRTRAALVRQDLWDVAVRQLTVTEPLGYLDMLQLQASSRLVVTDSGGVQKEAFFHKVPCVTLRDETEWTELVDMGWNTICPPTSGSVVADAISLASGKIGACGAPYGDGDAADRIAAILAGRQSIKPDDVQSTGFCKFDMGSPKDAAEKNAA